MSSSSKLCALVMVLSASAPAQAAVTFDGLQLSVSSNVAAYVNDTFETVNRFDSGYYSEALPSYQRSFPTVMTSPASAKADVDVVAELPAASTLVARVDGRYDVTDYGSASFVDFNTGAGATWWFTVTAPVIWHFEHAGSWDAGSSIAQLQISRISNSGLSTLIDVYGIGELITPQSGQLDAGNYVVGLTFLALDRRRPSDAASSGEFASSFRFSMTDLAAIPEPATWAMMIAGFGLAGGAMRRARVRSMTFA